MAPTAPSRQHGLALQQALAWLCLACRTQAGPALSSMRAVLQTNFGDVHLAFYPEIAPKTAPHIASLMQSGCYNSNHFFRVDKGFVAQTADVISGRQVPLSDMQRAEAQKHVPLEVTDSVQHHAGTLSMARSEDPNSGSSSFSVLLGDAPHLNMQYTIFGEVTHGMDTMRAMEGVDTRKEGIFVMPLQRVTILSTFTYFMADPQNTVATAAEWSFSDCGAAPDEENNGDLHRRIEALALDLQKTRERCLPGGR